MKTEQATDLADWDEGRDMRELGSSSRRREAEDKLTGSARYAADTRLPDQLQLTFVRSPHPHAEVTSIDASEALNVPGVVAVITNDDLPDDLTWYEEELPFFAEIARFVGDEVAAVVARTLDAARDGAAAVHVEYALLDHVTDPVTALGADAPSIHGDSNLVAEPEVTERGDVETALDTAAFVVESEYRTPTAIHNALEPHGAVAHWHGDQLDLWASTQGVNDVREMVAEALGLHHQQVRVVADHIGGGFGAKQVPWKPTVAAALASRLTGHPVQAMNDRRGENLAAGKRNGTVQRLRLGADADGRLVGIDADLIADNGAYGVAGEASNVAGSYRHLYRCDAVRTRSRRVYTNTGPAVAFRAPGYVEAAFALESAMDELAHLVGIDPLEFRRLNRAETDQVADLPWSSPSGLPTAIDRIDEHRIESGSAPPSGMVRGHGIAVNEWMAATAMPPGYAWAEFNNDGSVHIATSTQDIGTGTRTALAQVAAEELGIAPNRIRVSMGDTAAGPPAPTSAGSTTIPTMAPAVRAAASALRTRALAVAAQHLHVPADELRLDDEMVRAVDDPDTSIRLADLLEALAPEGIHAEGGRTETATDVSPRTHSAALADVLVDRDTGEIRVERLVVAPDCGRIIDRKLADSQVIGGATQGIGFALCEEQLIDHRLGHVVNANLEDYLVPTIGDTCEIVHAEVGVPDLAANPLGVKGLGELPLIPVPAAIANAVYDAIGVRFRELPLTRRRVLEALALDPADHGEEA
ncbi:MAG: xanthine dehydrogenase family protein molybdopterin-binding subunit [Ilumatobacteraceae bacterium]|nr:xanthine dehydrogenase family protein molybdopterin-binding subunit [Ilumatobacteraceae bacterium]